MKDYPDDLKEQTYKVVCMNGPVGSFSVKAYDVQLDGEEGHYYYNFLGEPMSDANNDVPAFQTVACVPADHVVFIVVEGAQR